MKKRLQKLRAAALAVAMTGTVLSSAIPAYADMPKMHEAVVGTTNAGITDRTGNRVRYTMGSIDGTQTGSIEIWKYEENDSDMAEGTGMREDSVGDKENTTKPNGAKETRRPIEGVQFTALKIADVENLTGKLSGSGIDGADNTQTVGVYYTNIAPEFTDLLNTYGIKLDSVKVTGKQNPNDAASADVEKTAYTTKDVEDALKALNYSSHPDGKTGTDDYENPGEEAVIAKVKAAAKSVTDGDVHNGAHAAGTGTFVKEFAYTSNTGYAQIKDLPLGLYLIAETDFSANAALGSGNNGNKYMNTDANTTEDKADKAADSKQYDEDVSGDYSQNHQDVENFTSPYLVSVPMTNVIDITDAADGTVRTKGTAWIYDITTYPKNQTTTITKKIIDPDVKDALALEDYEDYMIGDTVKQVIYADVPANMYLDDYAVDGRTGTESDDADSGRAYRKARDYTKFAITDQMQQGLAFDGVTKVVFGRKVTNPTKEPDFAPLMTLDKNDYKIIKDPVNTDLLGNTPALTGHGDVPGNDQQGLGDTKQDYKQFTVQLTQDGLDKINARTFTDHDGEVTGDRMIVVYFDTEVTPDAKIGTVDKNTNQATLTWKHTNSSTYEKKSNETRIFTYELDVTKKQQDTQDTFDPSKSIFTVRYNIHAGDKPDRSRNITTEDGYAMKKDIFKDDNRNEGQNGDIVNKKEAVLTEKTNEDGTDRNLVTVNDNEKDLSAKEKEMYKKISSDTYSDWDDTSLVRFIEEEPGIYHVYSYKLDDPSQATTMISPRTTDGLLRIKGLDAADYTITERATQDHFSLMASSVDVNLEHGMQNDHLETGLASDTERAEDAQGIIDLDTNINYRRTADEATPGTDSITGRQAKNGYAGVHINGSLEHATATTYYEDDEDRDGAYAIGKDSDVRQVLTSTEQKTLGVSQTRLTTDDSNKGIAYLTIMNDKTVTLTTGGNGVMIFYISAAAVAAVTIIAFGISRRKKKAA